MRSGVTFKPIPLLIFFMAALILGANHALNFITLPSLRSPRQTHSDRILLVTAYFPLKTAKHSHADYDVWLTNFMGQIETDMYIFCPPAEEPRLRGLIEQSFVAARAAAAKIIPDETSPGPPPPSTERNMYFDTRYNDCLETPVMAEFAHRTDEQWALDTEKQINNPDLYAIWNSKAYFVGEAVRNTTANGEKPYQHYFWQDAGAMRVPNELRDWPSKARVEEVFQEAESRRGKGLTSREGLFGVQPGGEAGDALILFPFWRMATWDEKNWTEGRGGIPVMLTEGSLFGGTAASVLWFESAFYKLFNKILLAKQFIGRDQDVFNTLIAQFPSHFFGPVAGAHLQSYRCGDIWYYYIQWLASVKERKAQEKKYGWDCPIIPVDFAFL